MLSPQLSLNFELSDHATWAHFYPGRNLQAVAAVQALARGEGEPFIYLHGLAGVGKTHLLQAACQDVRHNGQTAIYVSLRDTESYSESLLDNLETWSLVCLDDVEGIAGKRAWEKAVFNLFNGLMSRQGRLLIAAQAIPAELKLSLPDLVSRLNSGLRFRLHDLDEVEIIRALKAEAQLRGLEFGDEVGQFLMRRVQRDMSSLLPMFELLDQASLVEQRRLTVPFVKQVLGL